MRQNRDPGIMLLGDLVADCHSTWEGGKLVLVLGNGGSCAQADHFMGEAMGRYMRERPPLPAINLCASMSTVTCIANDYGYEHVFARQVHGYAKQAGLIIAFSTSGVSKNILNGLNAGVIEGLRSWLITAKRNPSIPEGVNVLEAGGEDTAKVQERTNEIIHSIFDAVDKKWYIP